jgi:hypothetical protein
MNAVILKGAALRQPPLPQSGPRAKTIAHPWSRQWVPGALSPGVKRQEREAHLHLVPRSRKRGFIHPLPPYAFSTQCLVKHKDSFTLQSIHNGDTNCSITQHSIELRTTCVPYREIRRRFATRAAGFDPRLRHVTLLIPEVIIWASFLQVLRLFFCILIPKKNLHNYHHATN